MQDYRSDFAINRNNSALVALNLRWILHKDLGLFSYKIQLIQQFKAHDYAARHRLLVWDLEQMEMDKA